MSHVDGAHSLDPTTHFQAGIKDLTRLDQVRVVNVIGSIQYGILYSILFLFVGISLHLLFPPFVKGEPLPNLFFWILLQSIVVIIAVFYCRKLVEAIPGLLSFFPNQFNEEELTAKGLVPYGVDEYKGDMASSLVLIGTQYRLLEKIAYFTQEMGKQLTK